MEKFLGLALWVTQLWPAMRTWLHYLYRDLHSIPASQFSVDPGNWDEVCACVSDELIFVRKLPFTAIPLQGHLIQVRHQPMKSKSDLFSCSLSDKRIWLRIRDPNSSKRKLSQSSQRILELYKTWLHRTFHQFDPCGQNNNGTAPVLQTPMHPAPTAELAA